MSTPTAAECAEPHRVGARLHYLNATGFYFAARGLHELERDPAVPPSPFVFYVNVGFTYELGLKCFLTHRKTALNLKVQVRHDLSTALREAKALGYVPLVGLEDELAVVGPLHADADTIRYLLDRPVTLPKSQEASLHLAEAFLHDLARQLPMDDLGDW